MLTVYSSRLRLKGSGLMVTPTVEMLIYNDTHKHLINKEYLTDNCYDKLI